MNKNMDKKSWKYYLRNLLTGGYLTKDLPEGDIKQIQDWIEQGLKSDMFNSKSY